MLVVAAGAAVPAPWARSARLRARLQVRRRVDADQVHPRLDHCGYLFVAEGAAELAVLAQRVAIQHAAGVPSELLSAERADEIAPGLAAGALAGAAYCGQDGYFDRPQAIVAGFARAAQECGASVVTEFVTSIAADGAGWRLSLADGTTRPPIRTRRAGTASHVRRTITALLPILEYVSFPVMVKGLYDVTPDAQPILGAIDGYDGLWVAAGLNGRGFMMAPVVGRFLAQAILGSVEREQRVALGPGRFAAGRLIPEGQVV